MRPSRIKAKLARNEPALGVQLHLTDPSLFELTSSLGFDAIWMDLEHHGYSVETAAHMMRAARVGVADIVARPGKGEFMRMSRLLEIGAQVIMYPRCDSPEEAAQVVRWAKFAPIGTRGFDGAGPDSDYCTVPMPKYLAHANQETLVVIQLEEQKSIDQAEAIAAVPGVDLIMLGPADFSILEGFPGEFSHPRVQEARKKVAAAARNAGKHWAATVPSPEQAKEVIEQGCRLLFHNADIVMVLNGLRQMQAQFEPLGFGFEGRQGGAASSYLTK